MKRIKAIGRNYYFLIVIALLIRGVSVRASEKLWDNDALSWVNYALSEDMHPVSAGSDIGKIYFPLGGFLTVFEGMTIFDAKKLTKEDTEFIGQFDAFWCPNHSLYHKSASVKNTGVGTSKANGRDIINFLKRITKLGSSQELLAEAGKTDQVLLAQSIVVAHELKFKADVKRKIAWNDLLIAAFTHKVLNEPCIREESLTVVEGTFGVKLKVFIEIARLKKFEEALPVDVEILSLKDFLKKVIAIK